MTHHIDMMVGRRITHTRKLAGLTQKDLADKIGITFQQLQKYEKATNRISASRLFDLAYALKVPPSHFMDHGSKHNPIILDTATIRLLARYEAMTPAKQKLLSKLAKDL